MPFDWGSVRQSGTAKCKFCTQSHTLSVTWDDAWRVTRPSEGTSISGGDCDEELERWGLSLLREGKRL